MRSYRRLVALAVVGLVGMVAACTPRYHYVAYDPFVEERLAALEAALQAQDTVPVSSSQGGASQQDRLDRIEGQLAAIQSTLAIMVQGTHSSGEVRPPSAEAMPAIVEEPALTRMSPSDDATPIAADDGEAAPLLTVSSPEFQFKGWNFFERRLRGSLDRKFSAEIPARMQHTNTSNRNDLLGKPLTRRRFLGPSGEIINLDDFRGARNVLLIFHRGFAGQVCVACSVHTVRLVEAADDFAALNTQVFIVYPGDARSIPAFLDAVRNIDGGIQIPYPLLLDVDLGAVKELQIEGALAKPSALLLDREGVVQYAYTGKRFDDRPSVPTLLAEIKRVDGNEP